MQQTGSARMTSTLISSSSHANGDSLLISTTLVPWTNANEKKEGEDDSIRRLKPSGEDDVLAQRDEPSQSNIGGMRGIMAKLKEYGLAGESGDVRCTEAVLVFILVGVLTVW